jgi:hypothetical protein
MFVQLYGNDTYLCSVNELIRQYDITRCDFLLQASYGTESYDSFHANALESCNISS